ncbi:MAG: response regulator [Oscillospiraceae bacterium]|nr:response regulator [Oscillospiraceae bacterium]
MDNNFLLTIQITCVALMFVYIVYIVTAKKAGAYSVLTAALASAFLNCFAYTMLLFADSPEAAIAVKPFDIMGSSLAMYLLYWFACENRRLKIPKAVSILLLAADLFGIIACASDKVFHLYFRGITLTEQSGVQSADVKYNIGFYALLASMSIKTIVIAAAAFVKRRSENAVSSSARIRFSFLTVLLPTAAMTLYYFRVFGDFNPSSLAMCICCVSVTASVYSVARYDMVKTARDSVIETMDDALIVTDNKMNIVDSNPAARRIFPALSDDDRRKTAEFALNLISASDSEGNSEFELNGKYYEKHITSLYNSDGGEDGYSVLVIDVTDTKKYVDNLIDISRKADMANNAKSDFLANMSHEIRTPMNAITGFAELCLKEKNYCYAADIKTAAKNLISIINDILDISKIEAGKLELVPSVYDTAGMLNDVISIIYVQLDKKKNLDFKIDIDRRIPRKMYGDEVRLKQILINLLGNAIKFTNEGFISLTVRELSRVGDDVSLMFKIADSGLGIKKEDISKLFENFQQVDTRKNRKIEGSGLGLPISKNLAEKMNGSITVESEYGKGSVFTVILVQKISDPSPIPKSAAGSVHAPVSEEKTHTLYAPDAHVLVVDDNKVNLNVTARLLDSYGIKAELADSGRKAIEMINSAYYDLVFMDHMMPELDGVDTTKMIRSQNDAYSKELPIIALTANAVSGAREMFLESGFNDFISKPIQLPLLEKILEKWLPEQMISYTETGAKTVHTDASDISDIFGGGHVPADTAPAEANEEDDIVIPNVDVKAGLSLCGGNVDAYLAILKTFMETAAESILRIETFAHSRDYKNYTTEVHGLKSSSLAIGAAGLSEMAKNLEQAGKEENYKQISEDTPALIARFSEIAENIKPFVETEKSDDANKPPIKADDLKAELEKALEAIDELDSHGAMEILDRLLGYSYSTAVTSELEKSRRFTDNFAYEKAEETIRHILEILNA